MHILDIQPPQTLELNVIHNVDCLKGLSLLPDNSVDLCITSPPYNLGNTHHTGNKRHCPYNDDLPEPVYQSMQIEVLSHIHRILKPDGSQNFDKIRFYPMTERVYWLTKSRTTKLFNAINHHDLFTRIDWPPVGTKVLHTRAFPEQMVSDILSCFPKAVVILDPYMGSGTTAVCAKKSGKTFIGFELNPEYHRIAINRLQDIHQTAPVYGPTNPSPFVPYTLCTTQVPV